MQALRWAQTLEQRQLARARQHPALLDVEREPERARLALRWRGATVGTLDADEMTYCGFAYAIQSAVVDADGGALHCAESMLLSLERASLRVCCLDLCEVYVAHPLAAHTLLCWLYARSGVRPALRALPPPRCRLRDALDALPCAAASGTPANPVLALRVDDWELELSPSVVRQQGHAFAPGLWTLNGYYVVTDRLINVTLDFVLVGKHLYYGDLANAVALLRGWHSLAARLGQ